MNKILNCSSLLVLLVTLILSMSTFAHNHHPAPTSPTPPPTPQSTPTGSNATAESNVTTESNAAALAAQGQGQKQDASSSNNITITEEGNVFPTNASAPVLPSTCAASISANGNNVSFALSNSSSICESIAIASAYGQLGEQKKALEALDRAASINKTKTNWCMFSKVITLGFWPCG